MNRDTICVQGGYTPGNGEPRQIPIIQSTTFKYATSEDMGKLFDLEADGYFYSRLQNPTCDLVAKKICELEGGTAAMLTSSGQAANFFALFNLCEAGDHIVASSTIYGGTFNLISVTMKKMGIEATFVDPLCTEEELNAAFRPNTKVVFGETIANPALTVLDIEKFAKAAHAHGVPLIVDASQSAGILPINMKSLGAAYIAMPGHKGLYGPQGTGVLLCGDGQIPRPLLEGGTGSISLSQEMPDFLPDRIEAGTHNMPGIAGLLAGVRFVRRQGTQTILRHEHALTCRTAESLRRLPGVEVFAHPGCLAQAGVVSFRVPGRDVETVGEALARQGIAVRAGLHCAPLAHRTAGTLDTGTVRVSFSAFNTPQEADRLAEAVGGILRR